MKNLVLIFSVLLVASAFSRSATRTELPLSPFADTEVTTSLAFTAWEPRQRQFAYEIAFDATPSNNFEVAFGCDGDSDGSLSRAEADFTVGWDCGEWFAHVVGRVVGETEIAATNLVAQDTEPAGERRLRVVFTTGRAGVVRAASAQLCAPGVTNELFAAPFAWPYDPGWNRVRLTARGFDTPSASFSSKTTPDGSTITLR